MKEKVINEGTVIAHSFASATGSNYDQCIYIYENQAYIYNSRTDEFGLFDDLSEYYEFDITNKPSYHFNGADLVKLHQS